MEEEIAGAKDALHFSALEQELEAVDRELNEPEIWNNPDYAQSLAKKAASLRQTVQPWQTLTVQLADIAELMELGDDDLLPEFETQIAALEQELEKRRIDLLFSGKYDRREAVVRISAGVGGLDAQDFAAMLERMYLRWAEKADMKVDTLERSTNDDAGLKTVVLEIWGRSHTENYVPKTAFIASCASVRSTATISARRHLRSSKSCQKSTRQTRWRSTKMI